MAKGKRPKPVEAVFEADVRVSKFKPRGYAYGRIYVTLPGEYIGKRARVIVIIYRD